MPLVSTPVATRLTGLSTVTLREWTVRRALIPADAAQNGKGSPALFCWQTVLLLRIAVVMRDRFHIELQPHKEVFASLKVALSGTPFVGLWNKSIVFEGGDSWSVVGQGDDIPTGGDAVIIRLGPHLEAISAGFSLPRPGALPGQLELFSSIPVVETKGSVANRGAVHTTSARRRSA